MLLLEGVACGALHGLSFTVREGEVLGLLGADPAMLTALMEVLAGLRQPDAGTLRLAEHSPAKARREAPDETDPVRAVQALLASRPPLLLLDQPASSIGAGERAALNALLERRDPGSSAIVYAATEAAELFALSDRIAVLADGTLAQLGTPREIYDRPASLAVARLGGPLNELGGVVLDHDEDGCRVRLDDGPEIDAEGAAEGVVAGGRCVVCVRPERMAAALLSADQLGGQALAAHVLGSRFMGDHVALRVAAGPATLLVRRHAALPPRGWPVGGTISVAWSASDALVFPPDAKSA